MSFFYGLHEKGDNKYFDTAQCKTSREIWHVFEGHILHTRFRKPRFSLSSVLTGCFHKNGTLKHEYRFVIFFVIGCIVCHLTTSCVSSEENSIPVTTFPFDSIHMSGQIHMRTAYSIRNHYSKHTSIDGCLSLGINGCGYNVICTESIFK